MARLKHADFLDQGKVHRMIRKMKESVKNNVQVFREKACVTQEQLADKVGVSRQTIIAIEKGNYTPSVLLAIKLARYFKSSVEDIFTI